MRLPAVLKLFGNSIVGLVGRLAAYGRVQVPDEADYVLKEFVDDWKNGGKKQVEKYWRFPANKSTGHTSVSSTSNDDEEQEDVLDRQKEYYQGAHEWIPTNMLGYIVDHGVIKHGDIRWLQLADALRSPCALVVCLPGKLMDDVVRNNATHDAVHLTGHVGALSLGEAGRYIFTHQDVFHDELRKILKACLNDNTSDLRTFYSSLTSHMQAWYWQGDDSSTTSVAKNCGLSLADFKKLACPYHYNHGSNQVASWGKTMGEMAQKLKDEWQINNLTLENQFIAIEGENPKLKKPIVLNVKADAAQFMES